MEAVAEQFEERAQIPRRFEHAQPLILWEVECQQVKQLIHQQWPLHLDALCKEVEHLLCAPRINVRLRQVQTIPRRQIRHVLAAHQHHIVVHHLEHVCVLHQKVRELLNVLTCQQQE